MDEYIKKKDALNIVQSLVDCDYDIHSAICDACNSIKSLSSAQSEISRIEQELYGKTPEEQYEFLCWLLLKFGLAYTDSRLAVIEWLRGEKEDG